MKDQKKAEEMAAQRVQLLSPLLAEGLDAAQARLIKSRICEQPVYPSVPCADTWLNTEITDSAGLKPRGKGQRQSEAIPVNILEQAIYYVARYQDEAYPRSFRSWNGRDWFSPGRSNEVPCRRS